MRRSKHTRPVNAVVFATWLVASAAACSNFEDPAIVLDLRPIAVVANPAEVVVDIDPDADSFVEAVDFDDLVDVEFCGLIADPGEDRRLNYRFSACEPSRSFRCDEPNDEDDLTITFGEGSIADPETASTLEDMCATLTVTPALIGLLQRMIEADPRRILEGIDIQIELRVETDGPNPEVAYTRKHARYSGRLPLDKIPNQNPSVEMFTVTREDESEEMLPVGRCTDFRQTNTEPLVIAANERVKVEPIVAEGTAEDYVQLDLELNPVFSTEAIRYVWLTTAGGFEGFQTGGPKDAFGNVPLTRNFFALEAQANDIDVWIVQRDERLGQAWFRSCIRVSE